MPHAGQQRWRDCRFSDLLHEPTAAASYHCWRTNTQDGVFLVYDFGGGTFDVSILRSIAGSFEVLGISGNKRLGGDDLDAALTEDLRQRLLRDEEAAYDLDLDMNAEEDRLRFDQLKLLAEGVKKALSNASEFYLRDPVSIRDRAGQQVFIEIMYRRHEIEAIMRPIVERTIPYCFDALEIAQQRAGVTLADVDAVILAGGSTHIPLVREMVKQAFCAHPAAQGPRAKCEEPVYEKVDTIVALGAAIRAAAIGGLAVYNPERTVCVSFRGTAATETTQTIVAGEVEALTSDIDLTGGQVRLSIADQGYRDVEEHKPGGTFRFTRVPLQPAAENLLTFEVYDCSGTLVATAGRPISQSSEPVRPTGGASDTAFLVKAISLEVSRAGKPYRKELFKAMTPLPTSADYTFTHPGDTELIRLPLYQDTTIIQEIRVPVPSSLPRGTPIDLNIHIDRLSFITVKGKISDIPFEAAVELPPERPMPTAEELQALDRAFQEAIAYLPAGKRNIAETRSKRAKQSYEAAIRQGDREQAVYEFEEMEDLVANIATEGTRPLDPPKEFFDELLKDCYDLNQYATQVTAKEGVAQPHDAKELAKTIDFQRDRGEKAFNDGEQVAYIETIEMLENIRNHLIAVIRPHIREQDTRTKSQKAADNIKAVREDSERVASLAAAQGRKDFYR